jgi:hypothetical protein
LQVLAEASPEEFMDAVEDSLAQNDPPIMALFVDGNGIFGTAYHANLLWALEILAWSQLPGSRDQSVGEIDGA